MTGVVVPGVVVAGAVVVAAVVVPGVAAGAVLGLPVVAARTWIAPPPRACERLGDDLAADERHGHDGEGGHRQPAGPPAEEGRRSGGRVHAERDRGCAAGVAPAEVMQRLGRPLICHERAQARLAAGAPAQIEPLEPPIRRR